jgi:hypothetical protein
MVGSVLGPVDAWRESLRVAEVRAGAARGSGRALQATRHGSLGRRCLALTLHQPRSHTHPAATPYLAPQTHIPQLLRLQAAVDRRGAKLAATRARYEARLDRMRASEEYEVGARGAAALALRGF